MLFELLEESCQAVARDAGPERVEDFCGVWREQRPEFFAELAERLPADEAERAVSRIARFALDRIGEIPVVARAMRAALEEERTHPAVRCAMVGALAYLVQPRDILPDDLPGGYGWLDDSMILRTTQGEYFDLLPAELAEGSEAFGGERRVLGVLAMCLPTRRLFLVQGALDGVWHLFQRLLALPADQAEHTTRALIQDPLGARLPIQGFTAPFGPAPDISQPPGGGSVTFEGQTLAISMAGGGVVRLP